MIAVCEAGLGKKLFGRSDKSVKADPEVVALEIQARRKERVLAKYAEYEQLTKQAAEEEGEKDDKSEQDDKTEEDDKSATGEKSVKGEKSGKEDKIEADKPKSDPNREFFKDTELNQEQNDIINDYKVHVKSLSMESLFPSETLTNLMSYIGTKTRLSLSLDEGLSFDRPSLYTYVAISRLDETKLQNYAQSAGIKESDLTDSCRNFFQGRSKYNYAKEDPSVFVRPEIPVEQFVSLAKESVSVNLLAYEALLANTDVFILELYSKLCTLTEAKDQIGDLDTLF